MSTISNVVQIVFWIVVGWIAVLTFRQARKTVLQPLRTEVFKLQLGQMRQVLAMFVGRGESELRADAHINALHEANITRLVDEYGEAFFPIKIDRENRPYAGINMFQVSDKALRENSTLSTAHIKSLSVENVSPEEARRKRRESWPGRFAFEIVIPPGMAEYEGKIMAILEDPLLPSECARLLEEYLRAIGRNTQSIESLLTWGADKLPELYPSLDEFRAATDDWIRNRWNGEIENLKPHADRIVEFARGYFNSDEFAPSSGPDRRGGSKAVS